MSDCRCDPAFDNRNGHAMYCPVGKDDRIARLEAENATLREDYWTQNECIANQHAKIAQYKAAIDDLSHDMHTTSSRPCPTCCKMTVVLGVPFGCARVNPISEPAQNED